jgi:hypothetical protein
MKRTSACFPPVQRFALAIGSATLAVLVLAPVHAQNAEEAARAAEAVASRASAAAIERVDPDTRVRAPTTLLDQAETPPLAAPSLATVVPPDDEVTYAEAPRGPAVRMITQEVIQPLPAAPAAPTPVAQTARAPATRGKEPFVVKSILAIDGSIRYGDWFWDESNAPATGTLVITIDLEARVISAFREGHEIGTAVALLGTPSHPTPLGTFPVLNKSREHFSRKYNNAPMPWSLWLTTTGIAIHGSPVTNGYASHGCIGVPDPFAAKLFAATGRGDKVIITRGKMIGIGDKVI